MNGTICILIYNYKKLLIYHTSTVVWLYFSLGLILTLSMLAKTVICSARQNGILAYGREVTEIKLYNQITACYLLSEVFFTRISKSNGFNPTMIS